MRSQLALLSGLLLLLLVNYSIFQKEQVLAQGEVVLLELAPVDPRSLMQGDYMALDYALGRTLREKGLEQDGTVIVVRDTHNVGHFRRLDDRSPLTENELRLRYRLRNQRIQLGTNAFFFQEGQAERYASARYGEFRVDPAGNLLLTRLKDAQFRQPEQTDIVETPKLD